MAHLRYRSDGLLAKRTARRMTTPYAPLMSDVVRAGWNEWTQLGVRAPATRMKIRRLGRAVDVCDFMTFEALKAFGGVGGCEITRESNQTVLTFGDGELRVSFNKIDPGRLPKPRSGRQLRIFYQDDVRAPVMPGMPQVTWARCGYVLDPTETGIDRVVLVCFQRGVPAWVIDLPERAAKVTALSATSVVPLATRALPAPKIASAAPQTAEEGQTGSS